MRWRTPAENGLKSPYPFDLQCKFCHFRARPYINLAESVHKRSRTHWLLNETPSNFTEVVPKERSEEYCGKEFCLRRVHFVSNLTFFLLPFSIFYIYFNLTFFLLLWFIYLFIYWSSGMIAAVNLCNNCFNISMCNGLPAGCWCAEELPPKTAWNRPILLIYSVNFAIFARDPILIFL